MPQSGGRRAPRSFGRGLAVVVLLGVLVGVPIAGAALARDLFEVRASLQEVRSSLGQVAGALGDVDVEQAGEALRAADEELADARRRTGSLLWSAASVAPVIGRSIVTTREVVEVASAAVDLAGVAAAEGAQLLGDGVDIEVGDGRVDLQPLLAARELVDQLPTERLITARDRLAEPRPGWIPGVLLDGRADVLALADDTIRTITRAEAVTAALPGFLGAEGPRRYFVGVQTSAHLRGTGGLIGFWGVLALDDGSIAFGQTDVFDDFDEAGGDDAPAIERISALGGSLDEGVDADPAFMTRYGRVAGTSSFSQVNLEPDLPTTARVALDLFEKRTGERLDGLVLLDPDGLQGLLEATGSKLPISTELAAALGTEPEIRTDQFARLISIDIYETLGSDRGPERKDALRQLGDAAFAQVFDGRWEGARMARAVAAASNQRHLQVFSEDRDEQAAFTEVGATGSLTATPGTDLLAVTANNTVGGKQDVHLGHEFEVAVHLRDVQRADDGSFTASRDLDLEVTVDNPLPASGMDEYIIGNCVLPDEVNRCFEGPPGWNWTWFSTWLPGDTALLATRTADGAPLDGRGMYRDLTVIDHFLGTEPQSRASFGMEVAGQAPLRLEDDSLVYELRWWRQSKGIPDLLDVRVHPPDGWVVGDVEVEGGGTGRGAGVHGRGVQLEASVDDGSAWLRGTVTAETRLRVHLVGAP